MKSVIAIHGMLQSPYIAVKVFLPSTAVSYQVYLVSHTSLCNFHFTSSWRYGHVSSVLSYQRRVPSLTQITLLEGDSDEPLSSRTILLCSAIAKMTASVTTYPHEVIRTRLQTQRRPLADDLSSDGMIKQHPRRGLIYTTKNLIRKEGWISLYKGLSINLLRTVPNSAVTMLTCVSSSPAFSSGYVLTFSLSSSSGMSCWWDTCLHRPLDPHILLSFPYHLKALPHSKSIIRVSLQTL